MDNIYPVSIDSSRHFDLFIVKIAFDRNASLCS